MWGTLQVNKLVVVGKIIKIGFSHTNKVIIERLEGEGERHVRMLSLKKKKKKKKQY